jgi:hypothetical protein
MVVEVGARLVRVQVKSGRLAGDVVKARIGTSRRGVYGHIHTTYTAAEIDGFAIHCPELGRNFWVPIAEAERQSLLHLRLTPVRNNQRAFVKMADAYPLGAIAQLEERLHGMQEVAGSSPASSITKAAS